MNPNPAAGSPADPQQPVRPLPQPPARPDSGPIAVPQRQDETTTPDMPETAFGFADVADPTPPLAFQQPTSQLTEQSTPTTTPPNPVSAQELTLNAQPIPTNVTTPAASIPAPAPTPQVTLQSAPAKTEPMPPEILPPQQIPVVPAAAPTVNTAQPLATSTATFGATATSAAPAQVATASYTPSTPHLPSELAERITETPMKNSSDIAKEIAQDSRTNRLKSIVSFFIFTAAIFVAAFLINQFIFQSYYVDGTSMTPTLQNNDRLIISKVERTWANVQGKTYIPERGQIVVLDSSLTSTTGQKVELIKRVIGLPGDRIHIENGVVNIANQQFPEGVDMTKQLGLKNLAETYVDATIDITVPDNQIYVMGDNRAQGGSLDSRTFGPVDGNKIQGRLWARILPFDKAQIF